MRSKVRLTQNKPISNPWKKTAAAADEVNRSGGSQAADPQRPDTGNDVVIAMSARKSTTKKGWTPRCPSLRAGEKHYDQQPLDSIVTLGKAPVVDSVYLT